MGSKSKMFKRFTVIMLLVCMVFGSFGSVFAQLDDSGFDSAFQGPKILFYGATYQPSGATEKLQYTRWSFNDASLHRFDSAFSFDADGYSSGKPNVQGGKTSVFIPSDSLEEYKDWIPMAWFTENQYITNPVKTYEWEIDDKMYYMEEWLLRWYVSFSAEWDGGEGPEPEWWIYASPALLATWTESNLYTDLNVWMEIDLTPTWYVEGNGIPYFAIGKMQLAKAVKYTSHGVVSTLPQSQSDVMFLHYNPFGAEGNEGVETNAYDYKGKKLNPAYFRDKLYTQIDLAKFGVYGATENLVPFKEGDTATFVFDVTVFCIGEWTVQDVLDDPDNYGRFKPKTGGIFDFLADLITSPFGTSMLIIYLVIGIVLLMIFVPGASAMLLGGGKRGGGLQTIIILVVLAALAIIILPRLFGG